MELKVRPRQGALVPTMWPVEKTAGKTEDTPATIKRGMRGVVLKEGGDMFVLWMEVDQVLIKNRLVHRIVRFYPGTVVPKGDTYEVAAQAGGTVLFQSELTLEGPPLRAALVAADLVDGNGQPESKSVPAWAR